MRLFARRVPYVATRIRVPCPKTVLKPSSKCFMRPGTKHLLMVKTATSWQPQKNAISLFKICHIYIPGKPHGHFFLSIMGFTRNGRFFVQLRILVFDCEGLFKSFDNTVFGHPPTVSKRGISVQSGANWESWSGTQIWPQILPYFPPNLDVPIKYQYFFHIMLKKNSRQMSTYCPKYCL